MKTVGIIAEYNPFHTGHAYQIQKAREASGADYCIVVMSGDFVQRGEPAVFSKRLRAEAALRNGADLVLELPVRVSTASAEGFASGGTMLLNSLGCVDLLSFGTEYDDLSTLYAVADILIHEPDTYKKTLSAALTSGKNFPAAREQAVLASCPSAIKEPAALLLKEPNSILALEYIKALRRQESSMEVLPILRQGASYHDHTLSKGESYSSATALRAAIAAGNEAWKNYVPADLAYGSSGYYFDQTQTDLDIYEEMQPKSSVSCLLPDDLSAVLGYALQNAVMDGSLYAIDDLSEDLARRIENQLEHYTGFSEFCTHLNNKSTTYSHISRALIHILLGIKKETPKVSYAHVLGFRKDAEPLLKMIKETSGIPLITSPAKAGQILSGDDLRQLKEDIHASSVYRMLYAQKYGLPAGSEYREPILVI